MIYQCSFTIRIVQRLNRILSRGYSQCFILFFTLVLTLPCYPSVSTPYQPITPASSCIFSITYPFSYQSPSLAYHRVLLNSLVQSSARNYDADIPHDRVALSKFCILAPPPVPRRGIGVSFIDTQETKLLISKLIITRRLPAIDRSIFCPKIKKQERGRCASAGRPFRAQGLCVIYFPSRPRLRQWGMSQE